MLADAMGTMDLYIQDGEKKSGRSIIYRQLYNYTRMTCLTHLSRPTTMRS